MVQSVGGDFAIASKEHANATMRPSLKINYETGNTSTNDVGMSYLLYDIDNNTQTPLSSMGSYTFNDVGDNISLEAIPADPSQVGSIFMEISGAVDDTYNENVAPYFFFAGNTSANNPKPWPRPTGLVTVVVRVYDIAQGEATGAQPIKVDSFNIDFTSGQNQTDITKPVISSFNASSKSQTSVMFTWNSSDDSGTVSGHTISYNGGNTESFSGSQMTGTINGLLANTQYTFTLTATDSSDNSATSIITVTTDPDTTDGGGGDTNPATSIWSEASSGTIFYNEGNVGIGTNAPGTYRLAVNGSIHSKEVKVDLNNWPDYVFENTYNLPTLQEIQKHIKEKGHLPNVPSAQEVHTNGILLGEMDKILLEKIEELTLYIIQQNKRIKELEAKLQKN